MWRGAREVPGSGLLMNITLWFGLHNGVAGGDWKEKGSG